MRLSLTTTGLLDPRQLAAWSTERRRAIHTAVTKGMQSGGREVRDAARSEMRSAFTVKRNSFISSMGVKVASPIRPRASMAYWPTSAWAFRWRASGP